MINSGETPSGSWLVKFVIYLEISTFFKNISTQIKPNLIDKSDFMVAIVIINDYTSPSKIKTNAIKALIFLCLSASSLQACRNVNFYSDSILWIDATSQAHKYPFKSMHKNEAKRFQEVEVIMYELTNDPKTNPVELIFTLLK